MCTNIPGLGAGNCDSGKVANVTCPDGLNQCMSLKGKMTVLSFTKSIDLKNCSNNVLCDSASDFNGKNSNEFATIPPPLPPSIWIRRGDVIRRSFMVSKIQILVSVRKWRWRFLALLRASNQRTVNNVFCHSASEYNGKNSYECGGCWAFLYGVKSLDFGLR